MEKRSSLEEFPNTLLRSDVLQLLEKYCTVIYYPLDEQSNNGFHVTGIPDKNGVLKHFVFLNTNQTIEKQALQPLMNWGIFGKSINMFLKHVMSNLLQN